MAGIDYRAMGLGLHEFRASRVSANSRSLFFIARYMASQKPFESTPQDRPRFS